MNKILFITAFPPSEIAAAEKNTKLMLRDLGKNFQVDLIYFKDDSVAGYEPEDDSVHVKKVVRNSKRYRLQNVISHPFYHPIFTVRFNGKVLGIIQKLIRENNYSAIIFDHSQTLMYALKIRYDGPKILLSHDVEAQRFQRTSNKLYAVWCKKTEGYVLSSKNSHVFAFCQKDVDIIKEYYGIDAEVCLDYIDERIVQYPVEKQNDRFVLFGNWRRADNYEGALWLLNGLSDFIERPITVDIIGKHFPEEKIKKSEKLNVNNLGFVDNPYPIIAECKAMLCPLLSGAGIKVKVIEALASGTPVLGTEIAFEGFSDKYAKFMIRCNSPKEFAEQLENLEYSLEERLDFKKMFIADYSSDYIPEWLNRHITK